MSKSNENNNPEQQSENIKQGKRATKRDIIARVKSLYSILFIFALIAIVRLFWIALFSPSVSHNAEVMDRGIYRNTTIKAHRGTILSREGEPLAISSLRYNVILDFGSEGMIEADSLAYIKNADSLSRMLARHFDKSDAEEHDYTYISAREYYNTLITERQRTERVRRAYEILPRTITIDEWHMIKESFPIFNGNMGYVFNAQPDNKRLYPFGDIARQTIGRYDTLVVNGIKVPGTGLELQFNNYLHGMDGSVEEQWIAHGFWARTHNSDNRPVEDGANVITTIDAGLQRIAHEQLDSMLCRQQASFGVAMVMEVQTGNILCMVSLGSGRERGTQYTELVNNHALKTAISPGSTMKLATAMALLEIGGYTLETLVDTEHSKPGKKVKVGNAKIEDSHDVAAEKSDSRVTLLDAFAHSSNVYFAKAVYERFKDNPAEYTNFLSKLRFNNFVGLEAYGEVCGRMITADSPEWSTNGSTSTRLPRLAYGYELDVPPVHMLAFYNGVANNGRMVAPRFVDRIERDGEVVTRMPVVTLIEKMCSDNTLQQLNTCMGAAAERSDRHFRNLTIPFGCKTGTAQMWSTFVSDSRIDNEQMKDGINGPQDNYYYGSIICTMPLEQPRYTIMVSVCKQRTPESLSYYGIDLAGPVASEIMEYIYTNDLSLHHTLEVAESPNHPTDIKGGVSKHISTVSGAPQEGNGGTWAKSSVDNQGSVSITPVEIVDGEMPDVKGMGLSDAVYLLESRGYSVTHSGEGRVRRQTLSSDKLTIHLALW